MNSRTIMSALAATTLVVGVGLSAASADAAPLNTSSTTQAGYALMSSLPATTSTTATFVVPKVTNCTASSPTSTVAADAQVMTGTGEASGYLLIGCNYPTKATGPGVSYSAGDYILNNGTTTTGNLSTAPKAGDTLLVTVSVTATKSTVTVKDVTTSISVMKSHATTGAATEVFDGISNVPVNPTNGCTGTGACPVPHFGTMTFSAAKEDGKTPKAARATALNLVKGTTVQILTGALNSTGNGWTETFKHT